jgi:hypothetical protein
MDLRHFPLSPSFSHCSELFCHRQNAILFLFKQIRTLAAKHRGVGARRQFTTDSSPVHCRSRRTAPICPSHGARRIPPRCRMQKSLPLPKYLIEQFRSAGDGFTGDISREQIALAVLRHFKHNEITVWDITGTQVYFRLGDDQGRRRPDSGGDREQHGIRGVHIHLPYAKSFHEFDKRNGPWLTRAGNARDQIVALVGDRKGLGSANDYVGELLKALEEGRYQASFVKD